MGWFDEQIEYRKKREREMLSDSYDKLTYTLTGRKSGAGFKEGEDVSDALTRQQNAFIRLAKDIAAGAVLILAIAAVAVAVLFFARWEAVLGVFRFFAHHIVLAVLLVLSAVPAVWFVWHGPRKRK